MNAPPLQFLMLIFAGWVNRHQQDVIEYLQEENRPLHGHEIGRNTIKRILRDPDGDELLTNVGIGPNCLPQTIDL